MFVTKSDGTDYLTDNPYNNIKYTGTGENNATTWTVDPATPVYLNFDKATAYAYYPHQASGVSLTNIPITNDGTDWMYSQSIDNLDNNNATAAFSMQHAMSIIRIKIERGTPGDQGTVSKVTIDGNGWATGATLNLKEGTIGNYTGENSQLVKTDVGTLGESALTYDHWVVPTGNTTNLTFKVTLDDLTFKSTQTNVILQPGKVYNYKLTVNYTTGLAINEVTMTDWVDEPEKSMDTEYQGPWAIAKATDGVYAINAAGNPVAYAEANDESYEGVAFVLNGKAYQVAKTDATGYDEAETVYWWYDSKDVSALTYIKTVDGNWGCTNGYLAGSSTPQLSKIPSEWRGGALADFNGQENTRLIIEAQGNGTTDKTLGKAVMDFRGNSTVNEGQTDWYAPACGELAFMYLKQTELNELLSKVSGTQFSSSYYWSSSEYSSGNAWYVDFSNGRVSYDLKDDFRHFLRLVRAI